MLNIRSSFAWAVVVISGVFAMTGMARAQSPAPPPVFQSVDSNSVDVTTGGFVHNRTDVVIGQPGQGGLSFTWYYQSAPTAFWSHNHIGYITSNSTTCSVVLGTSTETFTSTVTNCQGTFTADQQRGSTLTFDGSSTYTYTSSSGVVSTFVRTGTAYVIFGAPSGALGYLSSVTMPDGEVRSYGYQFSAPICYPDPTFCLITYTYARLTSVSNNLGYRLAVEYSGAPESAVMPNRVTGINTAVEYCSGSNCSSAWPYATYTVNSGGYIATVTAASKTLTYTYDSSGYQITNISFPDHASHDIDIAYSGNSVATINGGIGAISYGYAAVAGEPATTVTYTDSSTRVYIKYSSGRVKSVKDEVNQTVGYEYDAAGRTTKITQPEGNSTRYTYDGHGNVTEVRQVAKTASSPADLVTSAVYPGSCSNVATCNKPTSTTDAAGFKTVYTYHSSGGIASVTSPAPSGAAPIGSGNQPQTRYSYQQYQAKYKTSGGGSVTGTQVWRLSAVKVCATGAPSSCPGTADELVTSTAYPAATVFNNLLPVWTTAAEGTAVAATTSFTYTDWGDISTVDGPGAADTVRSYYDGLRRPIGIVGPDPDGSGPLLYRAVKTTYSAVGQVTAVERGTAANQSDATLASFVSLQKQDTTYDTLGRPFYERVWNGSSIVGLNQFSYDNRSRLLCAAARMNPSTFTSPPSDACTKSTGTEYDRIARTLYDAAGHVTQVQSAYDTPSVQTTAAYTYTANGQVATLTDARNYRTTYEYDGMDRRVKLRYPAPGSTNTSSTSDYDLLAYNAAGRLATEYRRGGDPISYSYDNLGRVMLRDAPNPQLDVSYAYDLLGRTTSVGQTGSTISTTYDALSRVSTTTSTIGGTGYDVSYLYNALGLRQRMTYPGGFYVTYSYDSAGEVTGILENGSSTLISYGYDNLGRRTSLTRANSANTSYTYGAASRLATLQNPAGPSQTATFTFGYNPVGQITSRTRDDSVYDWALGANTSATYSPDGQNKYSPALTYDGRGNLTGDGTRTYSYDSDNRMVGASGSISLQFDPSNRLQQVASTSASTRFVYDGVKPIAEYDATTGNILRRYVHGSGTDEPLVWYEGSGTSDRRWLIADERGSIIGITSGSGALTQVNKYDAYGAPNAVNQGRFQYTGQMWVAELGLYHYKARAYNPRLGRFMQTDPIGFAGGLNLYAYGSNDPINSVDPYGTDDCAPEDNHHYHCVRVTASRWMDFGGYLPNVSFTSFNPNSLGNAWTQALNGLGTGLDTHSGNGNSSAGGSCPAPAPLAAAATTIALPFPEDVPNIGAAVRLLSVFGLMLSLSGDTPQASIPIFRVVGPAELAQIQATQMYAPSPSGFGEKQFWRDLTSAQKYSTMVLSAGWEPRATIVSSMVSRPTLSLGVPLTLDGMPAISFPIAALPSMNRDAASSGGIRPVSTCGG